LYNISGESIFSQSRKRRKSENKTNNKNIRGKCKERMSEYLVKNIQLQSCKYQILDANISVPKKGNLSGPSCAILKISICEICVC